MKWDITLPISLIFYSLVAALPHSAAMATEISEEEVFNAACAFVSSDAVGSAVLKGCSVDGVESRGFLWIASLSPSGHIILSGSDIANPIVGFSKNDFVEPDPDSPALSVLMSAEASAVALEATGGERHAKWSKLLGGGQRGFSAMSETLPYTATIIVEPFLNEHFNQWQPYNDYCPVYNPATNTTAYRGRCPCGCVATAAAQVFHYFKWPARIDNTISFDHKFIDENNTTNSFPVRFDGHIPIVWNAITTNYEFSAGGEWVPHSNPELAADGWMMWSPYYDLRGTVSEATRHPISRLIFWCDVLARMQFAPGASSALYDDVANNINEWYTEGEWAGFDDFDYYDWIVYDMWNGIPLQVGLDGHEVVAHGWADDGESQYIYLNYGWGGSDDGYYNMDNSSGGLAIHSIYVGHYPRAKPQIDPLPKICGTGLTLSWHFPDTYTNNLDKFTIAVSKTASTESTFFDDFSATQGSSDAEDGSINNGINDRLFVGTDSTYGSGKGNLLYAEPLAFGIFTFADKLTLTSSSVLSFKLRSVNANACTYQVQASFDNGAWETIAAPELALSNGYLADSGWQNYQFELGDHVGQSATFRIVKEYVWGKSYYPSGRILLDEFTVSNVLEQETPTVYEADYEARNFQVPELQDGGVYTFTVTPSLINDGYALAPAETSASVSTTIGNSLSLGVPEILSVSAVKEGFYAECGTNTATFAVVCSSTVVSLEAKPSHLSLVSDDDVSVSKIADGEFKVCVTPSGINEANYRSRMILTLVGTDSNGTKCYKDLSLRFEPVEETASEVAVKATTSSGEQYDVSIPFEWLETNGLVASGSDSSAYEDALASDADYDKDGMPNWTEYVCGTSPTNAEDKLTVSIEMEDGKPKITYSPDDGRIANGFKAVIKGACDISSGFSSWEVVTDTSTSTCRFFRVEIVPGE